MKRRHDAAEICLSGVYPGRSAVVRPGLDASVRGIRAVTEYGWFAAGPSGTEEIDRIYAESFLSAEHLREIETDARAMVAKVFGPIIRHVGNSGNVSRRIWLSCLRPLTSGIVDAKAF